jgi:hypothetical protein
MVSGVIILDISILMVLISLFLYVMFTRSQIQETLQHNHDQLGQGIVQVVEQFQQNLTGNGQPTFKDAKQMMALRMDELKFMMLEKFASYASNKFLKADVGLHQVLPPAEGDINKPGEPTP